MRLIVGGKTGVDFEKIVGACLQSGIDICRLARAANEERGRSQERERKGNLDNNQRMARQIFCAPDDGIFTGILFQIADDRRSR